MRSRNSTIGVERVTKIRDERKLISSSPTEADPRTALPSAQAADAKKLSMLVTKARRRQVQIQNRRSLISEVQPRDFFPSDEESLHCDIDIEQTPVGAPKRAPSRSENRYLRGVQPAKLADLAELQISGQACQRIAIRIGQRKIERNNTKMTLNTQLAPRAKQRQSTKVPRRLMERHDACVHSEGDALVCFEFEIRLGQTSRRQKHARWEEGLWPCVY